MEQPDPQTLRKARRGDERAFAVIVRQYEGPLFKFILRSLHDRALAEELTQDILLRAYKGLPGFNGAAFTTWLFEIAKNRLIDEIRCSRRRLPVVPLEAADSAQAVDDAAPGTGEPLDALWAAMGELALELRMPLLLREIAGLRYAEIAATLTLPLSTVRWRIFVARQQLVESLRSSQAAGTLRRAGGGRAVVTAKHR
jgi:RNA polymerase sigma-70 factor (ECF subfamily)